MPDIFIYLCHGDHVISYIRRHPRYFMDPSKPPEIMYLKVDKSLSKVRDDLGGLLKVRVESFLIIFVVQNVCLTTSKSS